MIWSDECICNLGARDIVYRDTWKNNLRQFYPPAVPIVTWYMSPFKIKVRLSFRSTSSSLLAPSGSRNSYVGGRNFYVEDL